MIVRMFVAQVVIQRNIQHIHITCNILFVL